MESGSAPSLKLISLNIEGDRHITQVLTFLKKEQPEIICLQELFLEDFEMFKKELDMEGAYAPRTKKPHYDEETGIPMSLGVGLLSKHSLQNIQKLYYSGNPESIEQIQKGDIHKECGVVLCTTVIKSGVEFTIGTTHFTWTPNGKADNNQREDIAKLLHALGKIEEITLCGDFNAPRGGEIFSELKKKYKDNIPQEYTTSIDKTLHHAGDLQLMVDGLFTTPSYKTTNVRLVDGISDHMAIMAKIKRTTKHNIA
jgi:exonuclease III